MSLHCTHSSYLYLKLRLIRILYIILYVHNKMQINNAKMWLKEKHMNNETVTFTFKQYDTIKLVKNNQYLFLNYVYLQDV